MAKRNQQTFAKRDRERKKAQKAAEKRARREARRAETPDDVDTSSPNEEDTDTD